MTTTSEGKLAALVRRVLDARGINQADLAREMAISESSLSTLINRPRKQIPVETVVKLAKGLRLHTWLVVQAYLEDAGVEDVQAVPLDDPDTAIVVGSIPNMSDRDRQRLVRIAQDFAQPD